MKRLSSKAKKTKILGAGTDYTDVFCPTRQIEAVKRKLRRAGIGFMEHRDGFLAYAPRETVRVALRSKERKYRR